MPDSIMYQEDAYVLLEPNQPEQILMADELLERLKAVLQERQGDLPQELQRFANVEAQARHLMETACELDVGPGGFLQWFVIRLEK
jgi:hypothetical protein